MRVQLKEPEGPQEVRMPCAARPGNYEFQYRFWQLGTKQSNETQLISAQPRSATERLYHSAGAVKAWSMDPRKEKVASAACAACSPQRVRP